MALVLTLIMLSVILVMAVAFLAISRRERNAVSTTTDTAIARFAADSALAAAQAQIVANIMADKSLAAYNYHLLVSTNYIKAGGFDPALGANPDNVNYYDTNGVSLVGANLLQNLANLRWLPRAPVLISGTDPVQGRFYLDLNRNGKYDPSTAALAGDPEWIGVLERPDAPHSPTNKFISRFAFLAQPIGNSLDLNHIHNQTATKQVNPNTTTPVSDGYFRNQGVGSWELNLAAFLANLNTNTWDSLAPYFYKQGLLPPFPNTGNAFQDALSLLSYRYAFNYNTLYSANKYFANTANYPFNYDGYSDGPLQTTLDFYAGPPTDTLTWPWAGAVNTNRFFALVSDLFDPTKSSPNFTNDLMNADNNDSYTFYRLLDQLGTDSAVDDGRMNLNFDNLDASGNVISGAETNLFAWKTEANGALRFFTNAANRLLTNYTANWLASNPNSFAGTFNVTNAFGITGIPVLVSNQFVYTPAVNRLLQLAANIYDAGNNSQFPSVFRPMFSRLGNNAFITGYTNVSSVTGVTDPAFLTPLDASQIAAAGGANVLENVYGVPWIIGAKKGLPNFNQFSLLNAVQITRKVQVTKPNLTATPNQFHTNQMYVFSITNLLGCSLWNSYTNSYTNPVTIVANDYLTALLTNDDPNGFSPYGFTNHFISATVTSNTWPGTVWNGLPPTKQVSGENNSFIIPFSATNQFLSEAIYRFAGYNGAANPYFDFTHTNYQTSINTTVAGNGLTPLLPHFGLLTTNRLQVFILDGTHVIDYVHFAGPDTYLDINTNLNDPDGGLPPAPAFLWSTNGYQGGATPWGVVNQVNISKGTAGLPPRQPLISEQVLLPGFTGWAAEQASFNGFMLGIINTYVFNGKVYVNNLLAMQTPYTPTRTITNSVSWQANDPLVHYLASDLGYAPGNKSGSTDEENPTLPFNPLDEPTARFSPWGNGYINDGTYQFNLQVRDPLVWRSDDWDFPTNKYPTVGWLGRVHRGTPWQTVYLKASDAATALWTNWVCNANSFDATNSAPVQDRGLFDLFSATLHPNATFGTLSINQQNFAAWSAVFSGVVVLTNNGPDLIGYTNPIMMASLNIDPAGAGGANTPLGQLITGILTKHGTFANADGLVGAFEHLGDLLSVPQLTEQSPFLNFDQAQQQYGINDEMYEWLPQQTLGLLRVNDTPRYAIYCYGQTLRPAANSIVTTGNIGLVTNYQIMAESTARAIVRVDKLVTASGTNYSTVIESYDQLPPP